MIESFTHLPIMSPVHDMKKRLEDTTSRMTGFFIQNNGREHNSNQEKEHNHSDSLKPLHHPRSNSGSSLPFDLQKLVDLAEENRLIYEDPWTSRSHCGSGSFVNKKEHEHEHEQPSERRRDSSSDSQRLRSASASSHPGSSCLPPDLQRLVDLAEQNRVIYEDTWTTPSLR